MTIDLNKNGKDDIEELLDEMHEKFDELGKKADAAAKNAIADAEDASGLDIDGDGAISNAANKE